MYALKSCGKLRFVTQLDNERFVICSSPVETTMKIPHLPMLKAERKPKRKLHNACVAGQLIETLCLDRASTLSRARTALIAYRNVRFVDSL